MKKKGFVFYASYYEAIQTLSVKISYWLMKRLQDMPCIKM